MLNGRPSSGGLKAFAFVVGLAIPLALGVVVMGADRARRPTLGGEKGPVSAKNPPGSYEESLDDPLDGGIKVTLREAERRTPYKIPLPSHSEANRQNLQQVFASAQYDVALRFSSDVLIILEPAQFTDAQAEFEGEVTSGAVPNGRVEDVNGHPALVIDPDTDELGTNPGSVQFLINGTSITVYGGDYTGERLKEIASSINYQN